jgi:hypothetical protein
MTRTNVALKCAILETVGSQIGLAEITNIAEGRISKIVQRWVIPTPDEGRRIAEAVGRPIGSLFPELQQSTTSPDGAAA